MFRALLFVCALVALMPASAWAYTVYGYEDELGMLRTARSRLSEKYVPLYEAAPGRPRPAHEELLRLLREKNALRRPAEGGPGLAGPAARPPYPHPGATPQVLRLIETHSRRHGLDPLLVYAMIEQESAFDARAVSPRQAMGLMQIIPGTREELGLADPFDPDANIEAGARYMKAMLAEFKLPALALAAYNAGPGAVRSFGRVPPFAETEDYVRRILDRYAHLKGW